MNRLAWNFEIEIKPTESFLPQILPTDEEIGIHWESRFFWTDKSPILLKNLSSDFLLLSHYKIKHETDNYLIINNSNINIKTRDDKLLYKPIIKTTNEATAYAKKINLNENPNEIIMINDSPISGSDFMKKTADKCHNILVNKESLIYKILSSPKTKIEMSRLDIYDKIYFTVSIESTSQILVNYLTNKIIGSSGIAVVCLNKKQYTSRGLSAGSSNSDIFLDPADKPRDVGPREFRKSQIIHEKEHTDYVTFLRRLL